MRVNKSRLALNAVVAACAAALLVWLYHDARPAESRRQAINRALREGAVGGLTDDEAEQLLRTLNWLAAAGDVRVPILLNRPFEQGAQGALHVFTTTPAAQRITYCGQDNAVYDAELDAVFIDVGIVKPLQWNEALEVPAEGPGLDIKLTLDDLPFLRVYMRFVILHELGHRQLHGAGGGFFDVGMKEADPTQRRREDEADQFAVSRMVRAYGAAAEHQVTPVEPNTGSLISYTVREEMPPSEQVLVSLVEMAQAMTVGKMMLASSVSPFNASVSHRSYLDRSQGLVRQAMAGRIDSDRLRAFVQYADAYLERVREIGRSELIELTSAQPVHEVAFDEGGLLIFTKGSRAIRRVSYVALDSLKEERRFSSVEENSESLQVPEGVADLKSLWSSAGVGTLSLRADGSAHLIDQGWRSAQPLTFRVLPDGGEFNQLILPPQPSPFAVALAAGRDGGNPWLHSFVDGKIVASVSTSELQSRCAAAGAPPEAGLAFSRARLAPPYLYVPLVVSSEPEGSIWYGFAAVKAASLEVVGVRPLRLPPGGRGYHGDNPLLDPQSGKNQVVPVADGDSVRFILLNAVRAPSDRAAITGRGIRWEAWEVSDDSEPRLLASHQFLAANFSESLPLDSADRLGLIPRLSARGVSFSPPHHLLITWEDDSTYLLDLNSNTIRLAFHPDLDLRSVKTSSRGLIAIFAPGGRKIFLLRPGARQ